MSPIVVTKQIEDFENVFPLISETPEIYPAWKALVANAAVIGKQVHDARLAAVCQVNTISRILTFNVQHFSRYVPHIPGLTIVDPRTI